MRPDSSRKRCSMASRGTLIRGAGSLSWPSSPPAAVVPPRADRRPALLARQVERGGHDVLAVLDHLPLRVDVVVVLPDDGGLVHVLVVLRLHVGGAGAVEHE